LTNATDNDDSSDLTQDATLEKGTKAIPTDLVVVNSDDETSSSSDKDLQNVNTNEMAFPAL